MTLLQKTNRGPLYSLRLPVFLSTLLFIACSCQLFEDPTLLENGGVIEGEQAVDLVLKDRVKGNGADYIVKGEAYITNDAVITVKPGVRIEFEQDARLHIHDGALNAVGTEDKPITFTGKQATKGYWGGLFFINSDNVDNELTHCIVEYGGGYSYLYEEGNVILGSDDYGRGRLKMSHTILRNSSTHGMYISTSSNLDEFSNCTLTGNDGPPVLVKANNSGAMHPSNDYTGNADDYILVEGYYSDIKKNTTWSKLNVPYGIKNTVYNYKTLTIEAGVRILGLSGGGIHTNGEGSNEGSLIVNGTASDPVVMDGRQATKGYWNGIFLWAADANLTHCIINNAGSWGTFDNQGHAAVIAESFYSHTSNLTMTNCSITNSEHYGVAVDIYADPGSGGAVSSYTPSNVNFSGCNDGDVLYY